MEVARSRFAVFLEPGAITGGWLSAFVIMRIFCRLWYIANQLVYRSLRCTAQPAQKYTHPPVSTVTEQEETAESSGLTSVLVSQRSKSIMYHTFSLGKGVLTNPFHKWIEATIRLPKYIRNNERYHSPKCFPTRGQCQHHRFGVAHPDCLLTPSQRRARATLEQRRAIQPPMSRDNVVEGEV